MIFNGFVFGNAPVGATGPTGATGPAGATGGAFSSKFFQGYMGASGSWAVTPPSSGYTLFINTGGNTLTTLFNTGVSITAMGNSGLGIIINPPYLGAVYQIVANALLSGGTPSNDAEIRMTDGSTAYAFAGMNQSPTSATVVIPATLHTGYFCNTTSPITFHIEGAASGGTAVKIGPAGEVGNGTPSIQWSVTQQA